jgi:hypothetical protein
VVGERGVAQYVAQFDDVGAALDRLGGERVAQRVDERAGWDGGAQAGALIDALDGVLDAAGSEPPARAARRPNR